MIYPQSQEAECFKYTVTTMMMMMMMMMMMKIETVMTTKARTSVSFIGVIRWCCYRFLIGFLGNEWRIDLKTFDQHTAPCSDSTLHCIKLCNSAFRLIVFYARVLPRFIVSVT